MLGTACLSRCRGWHLVVMLYWLLAALPAAAQGVSAAIVGTVTWSATRLLLVLLLVTRVGLR